MRDRPVSVARNRESSLKMPVRSLASPNLFPGRNWRREPHSDDFVMVRNAEVGKDRLTADPTDAR
jgi:hypothetical protein